MAQKELDPFRLVGGTALSLYRGHRLSVDLDLFTDRDYGSIDFESIDHFLRDTYPYVDTSDIRPIGMGKPYFVGQNKATCIKLDLFYTDTFIEEVSLVDGIRMASPDEIIAMKIDVISRGGRKKDFWDIHEMMNDYPIAKMLELHERRYPYDHNSDFIRSKFSDFTVADEDFDPACLRSKHWEIIKLDMIDFSATK